MNNSVKNVLALLVLGFATYTAQAAEVKLLNVSYDPIIDHDLIVRDLAHLIPSSNTKIAYLKHNYLPLYSQHFIEELLIGANEITD